MFACPRLALFAGVSLCMLSFPFCYFLCLSIGLLFACCMYVLGVRMFGARARWQFLYYWCGRLQTPFLGRKHIIVFFLFYSLHIRLVIISHFLFFFFFFIPYKSYFSTDKKFQLFIWQRKSHPVCFNEKCFQHYLVFGIAWNQSQQKMFSCWNRKQA